MITHDNKREGMVAENTLMAVPLQIKKSMTCHKYLAYRNHRTLGKSFKILESNQHHCSSHAPNTPPPFLPLNQVLKYHTYTFF